MDVSTEIANFVVNLDPLSQEGFEISWVHDTIFNGVGAIDREFQVDLLLLETLALDGLAFNDNFGCLFLVFDGSLQRSSLWQQPWQLEQLSWQREQQLEQPSWQRERQLGQQQLSWPGQPSLEQL